MNKKGFTLVELLAVITLLALIALIIIPTVERTIKDSKNKMYEKQKASILTALQDWTTDNRNLFYDNEYISLTLRDLKEQNYIDYDIKNPLTDKCLSNNINLNVRKSSQGFVYEIVGEKLNDGSADDCSKVEKYPSIYLNGNQAINIELGSYYEEPGYTAKDINGNDITSSVTVTRFIHNDIIGSNTVEYKVTSNSLTRIKKRTVNVVDTTKPTLTIPSDTTIAKTVTTFDLMTGVTATDNSGTPKVKTTGTINFGIEGTYEITYIAFDPSGNTISKTRKIKIK